MPFTDDDLKRLKKEMEDTKYPDGYSEMGVEYEVVDALLARLEAAEVFIEGILKYRGPVVNLQHEEAWRRAAGK